jgi:hypothetical protein
VGEAMLSWKVRLHGPHPSPTFDHVCSGEREVGDLGGSIRCTVPSVLSGHVPRDFPGNVSDVSVGLSLSVTPKYPFSFS